jgi:ABC-type nickel/cobalt efflux system permease component RcnA
MFRRNFNNFSEVAMQISAMMIIAVGLYLIYEAFSGRKDREKKLKRSNKSELAVAFSAGVVPCPGVMTIVLFCIVLKQFVLGILAAIAMSIGMGLTISIAGILSISLNSKFNGFLKTKGYILEMIGGIFVLVLGVFLIITLR